MKLRDEGLRRDVADYIEGHYRDRAEALAVADGILALEEIDLALRYLAQARRNGGNVFVGCRLEPNDESLGHSISTNPPKA